MEKPALNNYLLEDILSTNNMQIAWKRVKSNKGSPGVDNISIEEFPVLMRKKWSKIKRALLEGYYVPSPVLKVEIPKKSTGTRKLGIPTILDRVIQQGITQILTPIFDPGFSENSFGFRPNKSAHEAIRKVQEYVCDGYEYAVDLDLEKFFDTVNHDILMNLISKKVKDKRVLKLIGKYLRAGILDTFGNREKTLVGTPQGGPLSPLLSNILLDQFDRCMESKNLKFSRYADDVIILCGVENASQTILSDLTIFLESKLKLKVNKSKSNVDMMSNCTFLGFTIKAKKISCSDKSLKDFKYRLKHLSGRSWGVSMKYRYEKIREYVLGWMNYYGISQFYKMVENIDGWLRRRIRMCYWKSWRRMRTKIRNLQKLGVRDYLAFLNGCSNRSYWQMSKSASANLGMTNKWLEEQGLINIRELWFKIQGYK